MRTASSLALAVFVATALSACLDRPETPASKVDAESAPAAGATSTPPRDSVEVAVGTGDATAFPLVPGSFLKGSLATPDGAVPKSVAVQIGNYANSADGSLGIDLCRLDDCISGRATLAGSVDNAYLEVAFDGTLPADAGGTLEYRIVKLDGEKPVAVWLYPLADGAAGARVNDQDAIDRMPKLKLGF